jgi:hypothetical protein
MVRTLASVVNTFVPVSWRPLKTMAPMTPKTMRARTMKIILRAMAEEILGECYLKLRRLIWARPQVQSKGEEKVVKGRRGRSVTLA